MDSQRTQFGTVLFGGFNKEDVYKYIEQLLIDHKNECKIFEHQAADLEAEIVRLSDEISKMTAECASLKDECSRLEEEKSALQTKLDAIAVTEE